MKYRIGLRLSDGRFVYATDAGLSGRQFEVRTSDELRNDAGLITNLLQFGYDDPGLSLFVLTRSAPKGYPKIEVAQPDLAASPVDGDAFVLGGLSAAEFAALYGDGNT